jgi:hypothetical protein
MYKLFFFAILNKKLCTKIHFIKDTIKDTIKDNIKYPIRNTNFPSCINCTHFIEHTNLYPYDSPTSDKDYGRCKKFGEINLITGSIEYDFAKDCRYNENKCGKSGSEYKEKD